MRDLKAIDLLVTALGGLTATARKLSTPSKPLRAQHIHNWRTRGRVSARSAADLSAISRRSRRDRGRLS
jgi:hypothetical protein